MNTEEQNVHDKLGRYSEYGRASLGYAGIVLSDSRENFQYPDQVRIEAFEQKYEFCFSDKVRQFLLEQLHRTRGERLKCIYAKHNPHALIGKVQGVIWNLYQAKLPHRKTSAIRSNMTAR